MRLGYLPAYFYNQSVFIENLIFSAVLGVIGVRGKVIGLVFSTMALLMDGIHIKDILLEAVVQHLFTGAYWNSNDWQRHYQKGNLNPFISFIHRLGYFFFINQFFTVYYNLLWCINLLPSDSSFGIYREDRINGHKITE